MKYALLLCTSILYAQDPLAVIQTLQPEAEITVEHREFKAGSVAEVQGFGHVARGYVCEESIDRFHGEAVLDTVTATVSFEAGVEDYRNIRRNGKPIRAIHDLRGAWTMADFGTLTETPNAEWEFHANSHVYYVPYLVSERNGTVVRETLAFGLPAGITKLSWGIKHRPDGMPINGWYQVSYNDGSYERNLMYWEHCRPYGAESRIHYE